MLDLELKQVSCKITEDEYKKLEDIADGDARSVSSVSRLLILKLIKGEITVKSNVKDLV